MSYDIPVIAAKFWPRVDIRQNGECWKWRGKISGTGYGYLHLPKGSAPTKSARAHRISWLLEHGEWPGEMCVCHSCDNPPCVNPAHLWLGSHIDNMRDKNAKGHFRARFPAQRRPLTDDQVFEIRERYAAGGITQRELAIEYGVTRPHVGNLIHGRKRFILGSKE